MKTVSHRIDILDGKLSDKEENSKLKEKLDLLEKKMRKLKVLKIKPN